MAIKAWTDNTVRGRATTTSRVVPKLDAAIGKPKETQQPQACATYDCEVWASVAILIRSIGKRPTRIRQADSMQVPAKGPYGPTPEWHAYKVCGECAREYVRDDGAVNIGGLEDYERVKAFYDSLTDKGRKDE